MAEGQGRVRGWAWSRGRDQPAEGASVLVLAAVSLGPPSFPFPLEAAAVFVSSAL